MKYLFENGTLLKEYAEKFRKEKNALQLTTKLETQKT